MANSYVGIVTRQGLEMLVPETEHAESFLQRRIRRRYGGHAVCCWAVLAEQAVRELRMQLRLGRFREALVYLNQESQFLGTLPPTGDDEGLFTAA